MYSKDNPESIKTLFDNIAYNYDFINNVISFGLQNYIKNDALNMLQGEDYNRIIDLCTGTGDIALRLIKKFPESHILATDFSSRMLEITRYKIKGKYNIMAEKADVMALPYEHNTFDLCTVFFGLRNLPDIDKAIDGIYKVLKDDAELLIVDLVKPKFDAVEFYFGKCMPIIASIFSKDKEAYRYLAESRKTYLSHNELMKLLQHHKFRVIKRKEYFFGLVSLNLVKKFTA